MKALVFKELREVFGIAAVAVACYLALAISLMGAKVFDMVPGMPGGTHEVPFTGQRFSDSFGWISVLFALALGFRQSLWESRQGTFLFLLHRPLPRSRVMLIKLGSGLAIFLICASLPILLYGWWAATPGHLPAPFFWSMTISAWEVALVAPLLYFGAFLSGLRPAIWFGTRLLPLVAAGVAAILVLVSPLDRTFHIGIALILYGVLSVTICFVAKTRDYA
jgi:hypothetical protein